MSYSSQTKEELCRFEPDSVCCLLAELSGIVCAAGSVIYRGGGDKRLSIETENNAVARRAFRLLREVFDVQPQLVTLKRSRLGGRSAYRIEISGSEASFVLEGCGIEMGQRRGVPREITVRKCCRMSFLRGVFLACGSVTDPEKNYLLEFTVYRAGLVEPLAALLEQVVGMPKFQLRRDQAVLYYRESENIEDALTAAGAPKSAMELMEVKIVRDMRNKVNRVTNCETANIDKTVTASARQIADIEYLILSLGLEGLPEELREVAVKRMENPELSLRELLGTLSEPLSRSGLNHRLSRLSRMAEELRTRNAD